MSILVAVAPHREFSGLTCPDDHPPEVYEVMDLHEALERVYRTDAHVVAYVVEGAKRQFRINKPGLQYFHKPLWTQVMFCDIDNPGHAEWTGSRLDAVLKWYGSFEILKTTGIYHTTKGLRLVQPLDRAIASPDMEPYIAKWFHDLIEAGLAVDTTCRTWNWHFRLPHVFRDRKQALSPLILLDRMRPIPPPEPRIPQHAPTRVRRVSNPRHHAPIEWGTDEPSDRAEHFRPVVEAVGEITDGRHDLYLFLSGALLDRGVKPEDLPGTIEAICLATKPDRGLGNRLSCARSTVHRYLGGAPYQGYAALLARYPKIALALDRVTARAPTVQSVEAATVSLEETIRNAPDGLTVIAAECGIGKTAAAVKVAAERAGKAYASDNAQGLRAPPQSKTSISVDKHSLAIQVVGELLRQGVAAKRLFGPLSCKKADGEPECRFYDVAEPLVRGGQPMQWELCQGRGIERCPHYDECGAKDGVEGPADARVAVGPHALLSALDAEAGSTGLLVIDEPPPLLETDVVTLEDLALAAVNAMPLFDGAYAASMLPALHALKSWVEREGSPGEPKQLKDIITQYSEAVPEQLLRDARNFSGKDGDALECACAAPMGKRAGIAPPLDFLRHKPIHCSVEKAQRIGQTSRVLRMIYHGATADYPVIGRIEARDGERILLVTQCNEQLATAVRRQGSVVVADANAELHLSILTKVVGYKPFFHKFTAPDGAPIQRTLIQCASATRTAWLRRGKLVVDASLVNALKALFEWAAEDEEARLLGIITMLPIEAALRAAAGEQVDKLWEPLDDARDKLGPIVGSWRGNIVLGHYGAVRGLNTMADVDCLATLGDPWPNIGVVDSDVAFLGLQEAWHARAQAMCRAELEQAHGRLRPVHRARPGRALHVGRILPSGTGWSSGNVEVRNMKGGRPENESDMGIDELKQIVEKLGGVRATARLVGCDAMVISRCSGGKRQASARLASRLRSLSCEQSSARCRQNPC